MANNQYVNKVVYNDSTLIDLTEDTVTPESLLSGYTAHDRSGAFINGTVVIPTKISDLQDDVGYLVGTDVKNSLTNTATDKPGSANMLRVLESRLLTTDTPTYIPSNADLNNYRQNGIYCVSSTATAETISNIPIQQSGRLVVFSGTARGSEDFNYGFQLYFTQHNGMIYTRTRRDYEPCWTNWTYVNNPADMIKRVNVSKSVTMSAMGEIKFCNYSDIADDCSYNTIIGITPQNIQTGANTVINVLAYSEGIYIDSAAAFTNKRINLLVTYATEALPTTTKNL